MLPNEDAEAPGAKKPARKSKPKCANHPDKASAITVDGHGAFQPISLCRACVPNEYKYLLA